MNHTNPRTSTHRLRLSGQAPSGPSDLALLVDGQDKAVRWRIDIQPHRTSSRVAWVTSSPCEGSSRLRRVVESPFPSTFPKSGCERSGRPRIRGGRCHDGLSSCRWTSWQGCWWVTHPARPAWAACRRRPGHGPDAPDEHIACVQDGDPPPLAPACTGAPRRGVRGRVGAGHGATLRGS